MRERRERIDLCLRIGIFFYFNPSQSALEQDERERMGQVRIRRVIAIPGLQKKREETGNNDNYVLSSFASINYAFWGEN